MNTKLLSGLIVLLTFVVVTIVLLLIAPWGRVNWGTVRLGTVSTITVTGSADMKEVNQVASFSASVTSFAADRDTAVRQTNEKMQQLVAQVKNFDIEDRDLQTQNVSIREQTENFRDVPPEERWVASNTLSITLRDIDRAEQLLDLLNSSDANNVSGPNFSLDDTNQVEAQLLKAAMDNAREKAQELADLSGQKLGKVIAIVEGDSPEPPIVFQALERVSDSTLEPGSSEVTKTLSVTFELR